MKIHIIAAGTLKSGPEKELFDQYVKRLQFKPKVTEIDCRQHTKINPSAYLKFIDDKDYVIILDEAGENLSSRSFAQKLETVRETGKCTTFIIGGADGIADEVKKRSSLSISFGKATWPHLLVRALLAEQLYRTQQILNNHPYHRD